MKKSFFDEYYPEQRLPHDLQVAERDGHFTGVLDAKGNRLYRNPDPVGFVTDFRPEKPQTRRRSKR